MLWIESVVEFVGEALRPIRRVNGIAQELGLSVTGVLIVLWLGNRYGWLWATVLVLSALVLLLGFEGARREHRLRAVKLDLTLLSGTWIGASTDPNGLMQYGISVRNDGADGRFNAAVVSEVAGATVALPYGHSCTGISSSLDRRAMFARCSPSLRRGRFRRSQAKW